MSQSTYFVLRTTESREVNGHTSTGSDIRMNRQCILRGRMRSSGQSLGVKLLLRSMVAVSDRQPRQLKVGDDVETYPQAP